VVDVEGVVVGRKRDGGVGLEPCKVVEDIVKEVGFGLDLGGWP